MADAAIAAAPKRIIAGVSADSMTLRNNSVSLAEKVMSTSLPCCTIDCAAV